MSLAAPQLRPLLARALIPLVGSATNLRTRANGNSIVQMNSSQQRQPQQEHHELVGEANQQQLQQQQFAIPQNVALLASGLAEYGPEGASALVSSLPVSPMPSAASAEQQQDEAAVSVLLLLTRTDFSSIAASGLPAFESLLQNSPPSIILTQLREVAAAGAADGSTSCKRCGCDSNCSCEARTLEGSAAAPAASPQQLAVRASFGVGPEGTEDEEASPWLLLILRSVCCCLSSVSFASRALAARALASYVLQRARTWGAGSLLQAIIAAAAASTAAVLQVAAGLPDSASASAGILKSSSLDPAGVITPAPVSAAVTPDAVATADWAQRRVGANERSGLLLMMLELLGRPEAADLVEEALGASQGAQLSQQLLEMSRQLQRAAGAGAAAGEAISKRSAVERVLLLQVLRAVARVIPERYKEELWARVAATSTAALGLPPDGTEVPTGNSAVAAAATAADEAGTLSFIHHVGLPALQAVSLNLLVEMHLRPRQNAATAAAAAAHLQALGKLTGVLKGAIALSVHPQAVGLALLAVADFTRPQCTFRYEGLELAKRLPEGLGFTEGRADSSEQETETEELSQAEDRAAGLTALWNLCWSVLTNRSGTGIGMGMEIGYNEAVSGAANSAESLWDLRCSFSPLSVAACEALAACAAFAAAHPRLCRGSCLLHPQAAAAAAAAAAVPAAAAAAISNAAAGAWTRLGAALLRCSAAMAVNRNNSKSSSNSSNSSNSSSSERMSSASMCFEAAQNQWPALWACAVLRCSEPTQEVAVRLRAAEALSISGLPLPCRQPGPGLGSGCCCSRSKLRVWRAMLLLLQDEDVAVREAAAAAASAAAAGLLCHLPLAAAGPTAACRAADAAPDGESSAHREEVQLLLAAAATPILSDEPHGLEAGTLFQLMLQLLSRIFPERDVCRLLWRQLRHGGNAQIALRAEIKTQEQQQQEAAAAETETLFEEEPTNIYGDPLFAMQAPARVLLLLLLQQQQEQSETKADLTNEAKTREEAAAVRRAVVLASSSAIQRKGAAVAALQDLGGRAAANCCSCGPCDSSSSSFNTRVVSPATTAATPPALAALAPTAAAADAAAAAQTPTPAVAHRGSQARARTLWLKKVMKTAAADMQALHEALSRTATVAVTEAGFCSSATWSGDAAQWLLHPTEQQLYLPAQQVLLGAWVSLVLWLDYGLPFEDKDLRHLAAATEKLVLQFAAATAVGQHPQPLVVAAAEAINTIFNCIAAATAADAAAADVAGAGAAGKREDVGKESAAVAASQMREEVKAFIEQGNSEGVTTLAASSAQAAVLLAECCLSLLPDAFPFSC